MNPSLNTSAKSKARHLSVRLLAIGGVFLGALLLFWLIANEMVLEQEADLDQRIFSLLRPLQNPGLTRLMTFITFFGSAHFLFPAYLVVIGIFLSRKKYRRLSMDAAAIGIAGTAILFSLKSVFHRHRPPDPLVHNVLGFSFPSGHSFSSFTFYGLLIYLLWKLDIAKQWRWLLSVLLFLFAAAIAFSRVYLRVHYASDVFAGFLLSVVWLTLSFWVMRVVDYKLRKKETNLIDQ